MTTNFTDKNLNQLWTAIEYTLGTIAPGGYIDIPDKPEWVGIHKSRADSSTRFLRQAKELVNKMKIELAENSETVKISKSDYEQLQEDSKILDALCRGGVDNWEWYEASLENIE